MNEVSLSGVFVILVTEKFHAEHRQCVRVTVVNVGLLFVMYRLEMYIGIAYPISLIRHKLTGICGWIEPPLYHYEITATHAAHKRPGCQIATGLEDNFEISTHFRLFQNI